MQRVRGRRTEDYLLLGFHSGLGHLTAERLQSEIIRPEVLDVVALLLEVSEVALFVLHQRLEGQVISRAIEVDGARLANIAQECPAWTAARRATCREPWPQSRPVLSSRSHN